MVLLHTAVPGMGSEQGVGAFGSGSPRYAISCSSLIAR